MFDHAIRCIRNGGATALILLLLAGCEEGARSLLEPPTVTDVPAFITWVSVTPVVELHAGETVQIEVGIRNPTSLPGTILTSDGCWLMFEVRNSSDDVVAPKGFACTADASTFKLEPGASLTQHYSWDGTGGYPPTPLPPGEYRVFSAFTGQVRDARGRWSAQPSNPVTVRILP